MPMTPLMQAVLKRDYREAVRLLPDFHESDESIAQQLNAKGDGGNTFLHYFAQQYKTPQYLLNAVSSYAKYINFSIENNQKKRPLVLALEANNTQAVHFILEHSPRPDITLRTLNSAIVFFPMFRETLLRYLLSPYMPSVEEIVYLQALFTRHADNHLFILYHLMNLPNFPFSLKNEKPHTQFAYAVSYLNDEQAIQTINEIRQKNPEVIDIPGFMEESLRVARRKNRNSLAVYLSDILNDKRNQGLTLENPHQKTQEEIDDELIRIDALRMQNNHILEDVTTKVNTPEQTLLTLDTIEAQDRVKHTHFETQSFRDAGEYVEDMMDATSSTFLPARERERIKRVKIEEQLDHSFVEFLGETFDKNSPN